MSRTNSCIDNCVYPEVQEDSAPTFFRHSVNGFWSITRNPGVDQTNLVHNPSVEFNANGWGSPNGNAVARVAGGYRGIFEIRASGGGGLINVGYAALNGYPLPYPQIDIPAGRTYYGKVAVRACAGDTITAELNNDGIVPGIPLVEASETFKMTSGEYRVFSFSATNPNAFPVPVAMLISSDNASGCNEFFVDGALISEVEVSIFDGDSLFASWNGAVHASQSTARASTRGWGETINLSSYGFEIITDEGFGYPPVQLITSNFARRAGASFQRVQTLPRVITLIGRIEHPDPMEIHRRRANLIRDIGLWDITDCGQEFLLKYQYTDACGTPLCEELEIPVEYSGGLEGIRTSMMYEQITMQFVANEFPYWRSAINQGEVLANGDNVIEYEGTAPAPVGLRFRGPMTVRSVTNQTNGSVITFGVPGPGFVIPAGQYIALWTQPGQIFGALVNEATGALISAAEINYANSQPGRFRLSPTAVNENTITLDVTGGESTITYFDTWLSADSALRNC